MLNGNSVTLPIPPGQSRSPMQADEIAALAAWAYCAPTPTSA
jgi:hypothetical protein